MNGLVAVRPLLRGALALAPGVLLAERLHDGRLLALSLLTAALLIGFTRCQRSLLLLAAQGVLVALAIAALFVAEGSALAFVALCGLYAFLSVWIARLGTRWSSVGTFTLIPALYLAYELHAEGTSLQGLAQLLILGVPLAVASVLGATLLLGPRDWHWGWQQWPLSETERQQLTRQALIRALAVLFTATAVRLLPPAFGPWLIWSSASVATGELTSSQQKGLDRAIGALLGLGVAVLLVRWIPVNPTVHALATALTVLTLVAFHSYRLAFACRCCGIVLTAAAGGGDWGTVGLERLTLVVAGGTVGLVVALGLSRLEAAPRGAGRLGP
ncbi:FUSC family protein [Cyanobium sp. Morenito 9A2]|uniref:FUSC family protein n=1 Tax=Cyanobium sp. Morenito 9A2 TaxID=2823718 RepID=UPI0020CBC887|nr:FUSC family protein [Cyanobium sp. Morenito 9A2]MCP9848646.1 FUSC family protein [Cyanobium sp. Morenito 9A2]